MNTSITNSNLGSVIGHAVAGIVVATVPYLLLGLPVDIQTMTVAGVLAALLKAAHLYVGS
jgi:hypothetical protein